jgi:DNA-binding NtrC family response regulator
MAVAMQTPPSPLRPLPEMNRPLVIVGHSAVMRRVGQEVAAASDSNVTVLIAGESGVGRRLVARAIHDRSSRRTGPFVSVNCICLPDARLESELFGDSQSGTDGRQLHVVRGRLETAHGGTVVLQDVGYLSWRLQGRLLRYTEAREVQRSGSAPKVLADVRLIAITHRRLVQAVANRAFRDDLFYRMNVIHIEVPPLRDRAEDIPALLRYFLCLHAARHGRSVVELSSDALNCLIDYDWPGNVRELKEVAERLGQTTTSERVGVDELPPPIVRRSMSRTVARWGATPPAVASQ